MININKSEIRKIITFLLFSILFSGSEIFITDIELIDTFKAFSIFLNFSALAIAIQIFGPYQLRINNYTFNFY